MPHLLRIRKPSPRGEEGERFPFTVPVVRALDELSLDAPVTFFVGENGSGKSTILEGLAAAAALPTVGTIGVSDDQTLDAQRALGRSLKLIWRQRTRRGFFLRAEDFFGFTKSLSKMRAEFIARLAELDVEYQDRSAWAKGLAQLPVRRSLSANARRYRTAPD